MLLKNKRLLILGANAETAVIVRKAQKLGVNTHVMDHVPDSPAKRISDGAYDIDGRDLDGIKRLVENNHFDGILLGVADPLISTYVQVCKELELPSIIDPNSVGIFSNKDCFRKACQKANLKTIRRFFSLQNVEEIELDSIEFPIILKPAISRGGKGIVLCNRENIFSKFKQIKNLSDNGEIIGEEYMKDSLGDCVATVVLIEGKLYFIALADRIMQKNEEGIGTVTYEIDYPSQYTEEFKRTELTPLNMLFRQNNIKNGIFNFQMFKTNRGFVYYDPNCIIDGGIANEMFSTLYNVDIISYAICYALTGKHNFNFNVKNVNGFGASIWINAKIGTVRNYQKIKEYINTIPEVADVMWRLHPGTVVTEKMVHRESSTIARIWIRSENREELQRISAGIRNLFNKEEVFICNI